MMLCYNMLDNVVGNRLVLVLLKSVPWLMIQSNQKGEGTFEGKMEEVVPYSWLQ